MLVHIVARRDDFLKNRNIFSYCYICKVQFFLKIVVPELLKSVQK